MHCWCLVLCSRNLFLSGYLEAYCDCRPFSGNLCLYYTIVSLIMGIIVVTVYTTWVYEHTTAPQMRSSFVIYLFADEAKFLFENVACFADKKMEKGTMRMYGREKWQKNRRQFYNKSKSKQMRRILCFCVL